MDLASHGTNSGEADWFYSAIGCISQDILMHHSSQSWYANKPILHTFFNQNTVTLRNKVKNGECISSLLNFHPNQTLQFREKASVREQRM